MNTIPSQPNRSLPAFIPRASRAALLTSICALVAVSAGTVRAANIVSQWNFDDVANAALTVSNVGGFSGTFVGATVARSANGQGVSGFAGDYALSLGGQGVLGARVDATTPSFMTALNTLTGSQTMSITYWQNLNAISTSTALWGQSASVARGLNVHSPWVDGNVYFDTAGCCANGSQRISGGLGATLGQWELITLIYNNGNKSIYRGTTPIASGGGANPLTTDLTAFYIGNESGVADLLPNARFDNFTLWSGALTPAEIAVLAVRPVPEPSTALLLGAGGLLALRRRRSS